MEKFYEIAIKVLAEQLNVSPGEISLDSTFEDIEADSIDIVEMIMALEDMYNVVFPEEDLEDYPIVGDLIKALFDYLEQGK